MKPHKIALAMATGLATGALAWAAGSVPAPDSYARVEAATLVSRPQSAWARAILFSDVVEQLPAGRPQRLDRKNYLPMKLETAKTVWVPEALAERFGQVQLGQTYTFAGTVDQISRRYYVIVDACYAVQTAQDMSERWIDMLNPEARGVLDEQARMSETAMQALLLNAQNRLIQLAQESNVTVAQLIEAQTDGGQRIAEKIVADALQGELKAQNKTADELMIGSVLALLQKQAVLDESRQVAEQNAAQAMPPAEPLVPAEPAAPETMPAPEPPVALAEEPPVAVVEETAAEPQPESPEEWPASVEPLPDAVPVPEPPPPLAEETPVAVVEEVAAEPQPEMPDEIPLPEAARDAEAVEAQLDEQPAANATEEAPAVPEPVAEMPVELPVPDAPAVEATEPEPAPAIAAVDEPPAAPKEKKKKKKKAEAAAEIAQPEVPPEPMPDVAAIEGIADVADPSPAPEEG